MQHTLCLCQEKVAKRGKLVWGQIAHGRLFSPCSYASRHRAVEPDTRFVLHVIAAMANVGDKRKGVLEYTSVSHSLISVFSSPMPTGWWISHHLEMQQRDSLLYYFRAGHCVLPINGALTPLWFPPGSLGSGRGKSYPWSRPKCSPLSPYC